MSLFSSDRERRLWLWTLAVLAAVYSTLGLATTLAGMLREQGLLNAGFVFALCLVGATVAALGLKARPAGLEIAVALGLAAAYLLVLLRMAIPTERSHLVEYSVVGALIYSALAERRSQGRRVPLPAVLALVATVLLGWLDEGIQAILPSRRYDLRDVAFNTLAAMMGIVPCAVLARLRRWLDERHR